MRQLNSSVIFCLVLSGMLYGLGGCSNHSSNPKEEVVVAEFASDSMVLPLLPGQIDIELHVQPTNFQRQNLRLESSDESVLAVNGQRIEPKMLGIAELNVFDQQNRLLATQAITVRKPRIYSIGNSHTWDFSPSWDFRFLAAAQGVEIENDWHIYCGHSMTSIVAFPNNTCVRSTHGNFVNALNNASWDVIMLQPYIGSTATNELAAIISMIDYIRASNSSDARIYVYSTWPTNPHANLPDLNYTERWQSSLELNRTMSTLNRAFSDFLKHGLAEAGYEIEGFIEVGQLLADFHISATREHISTFTSAGELYRDAAHLNNAGRFLAGLSVFSSIFGSEQLSLFELEGYYDSSVNWPQDRQLSQDEREELVEYVTANLR